MSNEIEKLENKIEKLENKIKENQKCYDWIYCLEVAGYDNWSEMWHANDIWEEEDEEGNSFQKTHGNKPLIN